MKWMQIQDSWIPDPDDPQGSEWTWNMVCSRRHPQWRRLLIAAEAHLRKKTGRPGTLDGTITGLRSMTLEQPLDEDGGDREALT